MKPISNDGLLRPMTPSPAPWRISATHRRSDLELAWSAPRPRYPAPVAAIARFDFSVARRSAREPRDERWQTRRAKASRRQTLSANLVSDSRPCVSDELVAREFPVWIGSASPGGAGVIAWEAHIGGFMAGLLLFGCSIRKRASRALAGFGGRVAYF